MIKYGIDKLATSIQKLFNMILENGFYPSEWKNGLIINIFKSGCKTDPSNYRGITLTSSLGKLFNSILNSRLLTFLDLNKLLSQFQAGFRHDHRTTDNIFILHEIMKRTKQKSQPLYMCFVDFHKAFDKLWRMGLLIKLSNLHVGGSFYNVIKDMYSNNMSSVRSGNYITPQFECQAGVRQGDSLSPTLFNIYVNDICNLFDQTCQPAYLQDYSLNCLFYADDLILISRSHEGLQNCLNRLAEYCNTWHLAVNLGKSKVMVIDSPKKKKQCQVLYGNSILEIVHTYKYLGIIISDKCSLDIAQQALYNKAMKAYFVVKRCLYAKNIMDVQTHLKVFDTLIQPILLYGCEVWGLDMMTKSQDKLLSLRKVVINCEKFELKVLKQILGVHSKATNIAIYGEFGRIPLRVKILTQIVKFLHRSQLECKNENLTMFYQALRTEYNDNRFKDVWSFIDRLKIDTRPPPTRNAIDLYGKKLRDSFTDKLIDTWETEIHQFPKLEVFSMVKECFQCAPYLLNNYD